MNKLRELWDAMAALLFPPACVCCGELLPRGERLLCDRCYRAFEEERKEQCPNCHTVHSECRCMAGKFSQRHLSNYLRPVTRSLVLAGKDRKNTDLAKFWAKELSAQLRREPELLSPAFTLLCYVPRNPDTVRQTGTDQAKLLAEMLAEELQLPVVPALYRRREKEKAAQKNLTAAGRQRAAEGHYRFNRNGVQKSELFGKTVLLVDDVITTGATVSACGDILRKNGVAFVYALAPARTGFAPFRWNLVSREENPADTGEWITREGEGD